MDTMNVTGIVATSPRHTVTREGLETLSFRLACPQRGYDKHAKVWTDYGTNWYTVVCFDGLARHASQCVDKGHRVLVTGSLEVKDWDSGANSGIHVSIKATALGHDLNWGIATFERRSIEREVAVY